MAGRWFLGQLLVLLLSNPLQFPSKSKLGDSQEENEWAVQLRVFVAYAFCSVLLQLCIVSTAMHRKYCCMIFAPTCEGL